MSDATVNRRRQPRALLWVPITEVHRYRLEQGDTVGRMGLRKRLDRMKVRRCRWGWHGLVCWNDLPDDHRPPDLEAAELRCMPRKAS